MLLQMDSMVTRVEAKGDSILVQVRVDHDYPDIPSLIYLVRPGRESPEFYVGRKFTIDLSAEGKETKP